MAVTAAGFNNVSAKYEEPAKLNLHFRADPSGLLHVEKGEAVIETQEEYTVKVHKSCSDLSGVTIKSAVSFKRRPGLSLLLWDILQQSIKLRPCSIMHVSRRKDCQNS